MAKPAKQSILCHTDGVAAIEFAVVLPFLLMFIMATFEYSIMAFSQTQLRLAVQGLSRLGQTGQLASATTSSGAGNIVLGSMNLPWMNAAQLIVCTQVNVALVSGIAPCSVSSTFNAGNTGDIVVYSGLYSWTGITPIWSLFASLQGAAAPASGSQVAVLNSSVVVQNETYSSSR